MLAALCGDDGTILRLSQNRQKSLTQICFSSLVGENWRCRAESLFSYLQAGKRRANGNMWFDKDWVELNHLDVPAQNK